MLIDFHTHAFPDTLAPRAISKLSETFPAQCLGDGRVDTLIESMDRNGVDRSVLLNIATNPHQQRKVNDFAIACHSHPRLYSLGSLHPDSEDIQVEARRLADAGIKGIKIHPDYVNRPVDDSTFYPVFEAAIENDLFVVTHSGWDYVSPDFIHCTPERIVEVQTRYPELRLVAAHFGANRLWEDVRRWLAGRKNLWLDTSLIAAFGLDPKTAQSIMEEHDPKHLLFGSDYPWFSPALSKEYLDALDLSKERKEDICYRNAIRLLGEK